MKIKCFKYTDITLIKIAALRPVRATAAKVDPEMNATAWQMHGPAKMDRDRKYNDDKGYLTDPHLLYSICKLDRRDAVFAQQKVPVPFFCGFSAPALLPRTSGTDN